MYQKLMIIGFFVSVTSLFPLHAEEVGSSEVAQTVVNNHLLFDEKIAVQLDGQLSKPLEKQFSTSRATIPNKTVTYNNDYLKFTKKNLWLNQIQTPYLTSSTHSKQHNKPSSLVLDFKYGKITTSPSFSYLDEKTIDNRHFSISGIVTVYTYKKFDLKIDAQYSHSSTPLDTYHQINSNYLYTDDINKRARLGVIGQYKLSKNWAVLGAISTSSYLSDKPPEILTTIQPTNTSMASFATSYSF